METLFTIVGAIVVVGGGIFLALAIFFANSEFVFDETGWYVHILGFGGGYCKTEEAREHLRYLTGGRFSKCCIHTPAWFNKYICSYFSVQPLYLPVPVWFPKLQMRIIRNKMNQMDFRDIAF